MPPRSRLVALLIFLALSPHAARAQDASARAEGRALFDQGLSEFGAGHFDRACPLFEASLRRLPGVGTRGKLAECYERVGRTASAWSLYKEVIALASKANDTVRVEVASRRVAALEPVLAHLTLVLPPTSDVPGLVVKRNGEVLERATLGVRLAVDPGPSSVDLSAPGYTPRTDAVTIPSGQSITFEIKPLEPAPKEVVAAPVPQEGSPSSETASKNKWVGPASLTVAGVGVVTLGIGTALAFVAHSNYEAPFSAGHCSSATKTCDAVGQADTNSARSTAATATGLFVTGAVLGAGGIASFFFIPRGGERVVITPAAGAHTGGVMLTGRF